MNNENWKEEFLKIEKSLIITTAEGVEKIPGGYSVNLNIDTDKLVEWIGNFRNLTLESAAKAIEEKYSNEIATDGVTKIIRELKTK